MKDTINSILPPENDPVKRWRVAVFCVIVALMFMTAGSFGTFSKFGWVGFARASEIDDKLAPVIADVSTLKASVKEIRLQQIEESMFSAKESECKATDIEARRFFSSRVLQLSREYFGLSGTVLTIPPCPNGERP